MISGLTYVEFFLTPSEEIKILQGVEILPWSNSLKRRTQHYGYRYDYSKKNVDKKDYLGPLPSFLDDCIENILTFKLLSRRPNQVIINEYLPGQGIALHTDRESFGSEVASLSLLSSCEMQFQSKNNKKDAKNLVLHPRSLLVLTGEARYDWMHGIAKVAIKRISVTFRTVEGV